MRKVEIGKLTFKNYCIFREFEYDFSDPGIFLVYGPNGFGKSTIYEGLFYALYGMTPTGKVGDDLINNKEKKNCKVSLDFSVDGEKYFIERYLKHGKERDSVFLYKVIEKQKKNISSGKRNILEYNESLLLPKSLSLNTIFFTQGVKDFFTDLGDDKKREMFRKLLDVEKYEEYSINAKDDERKVKNSLEKLKMKYNGFKESLMVLINGNKNIIIERREFNKKRIEEIDSYKNMLIEIGIKIKKIEENLRNKETLLYSGREDIIQEEKNINESINNISLEIKDIEIKMRKEFEKLVSDANSVIENKKEKSKKELTIVIGEIEKKYLKNKKFIIEEEEKVNSKLIDLIRSISELESDVKNEKRNLMEDMKIEGGICSKCKQKITEEHLKKCEKENREKEIETLEKEKIIKEKKEDHKKIVDKIETVKNILKKEEEKLERRRREKIEEVENLIKEFVEKIKIKIREEKIKIEKNIEEKIFIKKKTKETKEKEKREIIEKLSSIEKEIKNIELIRNELTNEKVKESSLLSKIDSKNKEEFSMTQFNINKSKIKVYLRKIVKYSSILEKQTKILDIVMFWKKSYGPLGIPMVLIDDAIPFINDKLMEYIHEQSGGRYIVTVDNTEEKKTGGYKDRINVKVFDKVTEGNENQISGGQKRLIDIAILLSLNSLKSHRYGIDFNIILFDEIFDSLDSENMNNVFNLLKRISVEKKKHIGIISHNFLDLDFNEVFKI